MKLLLLGANGQLGQQLKSTLATIAEVIAYDHGQLDLTNDEAIRKSIQTLQPDCIVNAAAYTAVDKAETEPALAFQVNAKAVSVLAEEAKQLSAWLIHYSTDYVFDGKKSQPYLENDTPNPLNIYGQSKLAGEEAITMSGCKHFIFRTTWVIGQKGKNFAKTILRLAQERETLQIINDQYGVPTTPNLITEVTVAAIQSIASSPWPSGIYHVTPRGKTTWHGIAKLLLQIAKEKSMRLALKENGLQTIKSVDYPTPAIRPCNSLLSTDKLSQQLSFDLPCWESDFAKVADQIIEEI